jgi:ribosomal protein S17E
MFASMIKGVSRRQRVASKRLRNRLSESLDAYATHRMQMAERAIARYCRQIQQGAAQ